MLEMLVGAVIALVGVLLGSAIALGNFKKGADE